jgi:DNA-binding CsgD family transcriptional regulator
LLTRGRRSKEVTEALGISVQMMNTELRNIYEKLQVRSRSEAVAQYICWYYV